MLYSCTHMTTVGVKGLNIRKSFEFLSELGSIVAELWISDTRDSSAHEER